MCMRISPARASATIFPIPGSPERAVTSLMMSTPSPRQASATAALEVSTEMGASVRALSALITGKTRRSSSSAETGSAPGRVDSPPTSSSKAPSSRSFSPCSQAACGSRKTPPSEKESGVTLTIPMTPPRKERSILRPRNLQIISRDLSFRLLDC